MPTNKTNEPQSLRFFVSGTVQGVGYRHFVRTMATRLGLAGYVKNLADGRVEVYAEGLRSAMANLRQELERGPLGATVTAVEEVEAHAGDGPRNSFSIEHDY